ncbi:MAG TPA: hypothetical protein PKK10_03550 [Woeseiaceae bacterium]|nr:hypothetical protein [Woeseiaceae bacterium]
MASLTAIFGSTSENARGSDKLLELYWNRAELKKEFANLREETFHLQSRIKDEQGRTARAEQKLQQLENLLYDREWVYSVIVHFQLKGLNTQLTQKLARFAEQLKQQREQRQHSKQLESWHERRDRKLAGLNAALKLEREKLANIENQLQTERQGFSGKGALRRFFCRQATTMSLDNLANQIVQAQQREVSLLEEIDSAMHDEAPGVAGLSVKSKRSINFMILSFAQEMYLYYRQGDLARLARDAGSKSAGAINYGKRKECADLLARIERYRDAMPKAAEFADLLPLRARKLMESARFRNEEDPVPVAKSVASLIENGETKLTRTTEVNLLGENYWGLAQILSR